LGFQNPVQINVPANQQVSLITSDLFGAGLNPSTVAWFQATSEVDNLTGYFLFLDPAVTFCDGADPPQRSRSIVFNEVRLEAGFSTELNIINPAATGATIRLQLMGGEIPVVRELPLAANGVARIDVATFFEVEQVPAVAYLIASSDVEIAGFEFVRGAEGDLLGLNARPASEQLNTLFFPQLAVLGPFQSQLGVANYSEESTLLTISAHQPDGSLYGSDHLLNNPVMRVLEAGQMLVEDLEEMFGFFGEEALDGWIEVISTSEAVNGAFSYGIPSASALAVVSNVAQGSTRAIFSHLATSLGFFTGVAVLNSGSLAANLRIVALDADGTVLGSFTTTLQPRQRISELITELIPEAADRAGGLIWVSSDQPVFLTSLLGNLEGGILANIPPQPVPESYQPDQGQVRLTVTPPLAVLAPGASQAFRLEGAVASPVWSVSDVPGGSNTVGTITNDGVYTAPGMYHDGARDSDRYTD